MFVLISFFFFNFILAPSSKNYSCIIYQIISKYLIEKFEHSLHVFIHSHILTIQNNENSLYFFILLKLFYQFCYMLTLHSLWITCSRCVYSYKLILWIFPFKFLYFCLLSYWLKLFSFYEFSFDPTQRIQSLTFTWSCPAK